jgi:hypothetical protein
MKRLQLDKQIKGLENILNIGPMTCNKCEEDRRLPWNSAYSPLAQF